MYELSNIANVAEILSVVIVIGGVFFAVIQLRQIRQQRREMAAIELFRFFGSPQFTQAYRRVLELPEGLAKNNLEQHTPDIESCAMLISTTMENIGVMVYHRIVPSAVVNDLIGNSTVILWRKLEVWIGDIRLEHGNPAAFEWFQWLSSVMDVMNRTGRPPAHVAYKNWKPRENSNVLAK